MDADTKIANAQNADENGNVIFKGVWTFSKATTPIDPVAVVYKVEHYQQQDDGSYKLSDTDFLLYGNAGGAMSGGNISGNTGHRGSAVMFWGDDTDHRTTFELSGSGTISGNVCTSVGKVTGSGTVHVENNASFTADFCVR